MARLRLLLLAAMTGASCASPPASEPVRVEAWGTMRAVLRDGDRAGRVVLSEVARPATFGVGALADLAGEVTIVDGAVLVATATRRDRGGVPLAAEVRAPRPGEQAALLVLAEVPGWRSFPLPACPDYAALDDAIARVLREQGLDPRQPVPVRVRARVDHADVHVIAGACPVATPDGPAPWRARVTDREIELVGIYAEDAAGRLTHHLHRSHLHAVHAPGIAGHLDDVALRTGGELLLPAR